MKFEGLVIKHEDSSYDSKAKGRISQDSLTCLDASPNHKLSDTVDVVFDRQVYAEASKLVGKTVVFDVDQIRPSQTMRPRLIARTVSLKS